MLIVILALLLVGAAIDQARGQGRAPAPAAPAGAGSASALAPPSAQSSSWYCQGATSPSPGTGSPSPSTGPVTASLLLANAADRPVAARVVVAGSRKATSLTVAAHGRAVVAENGLARGGDVAATVDLSAGGVAVDQRLSGPEGLATAPCLSQVGRRWYFAAGSTLGADRLLVALYDPLPTAAIADVAFVTEAGAIRPSDDQGIVVAPGQQVVLDVGQHVQQRRLIATTVTVRLGRLAASESQLDTSSATSTTPATSANGLALLGGAPSAGPVWYFPAGLIGPGAAEQLSLYNPSTVAAQVTVEVALAAGSAGPMALSVAPGSVVALDANGQHRIPLGTLFAFVVHSTNGVGVVAERTVTDGPPRPQTGLADLLGGLPARRWVVAGGSPSPASVESIVVENPGTAPVELSTSLLGAGAAAPRGQPALSTVVAPGRPVALPLAAHLSRTQLELPLVLSATGPIVVEQDLSQSPGRGISTLLGQPAG